MESLDYKDIWGHPTKKAMIDLVHKLMAEFLEVTQRPLAQDAVAKNAQEVTQRPLAQDAVAKKLPPPPPQRPQDPAALLPRFTGGGGDVLDTETEYLGWEEDLRAQHGVVHPTLKAQLGLPIDKTYWCELCEVPVPSWTQVPNHCRGARHKKRAGGGAVEFVRAAAPTAALDTEVWPPLLRHAHNGNLDDVCSALEGRADPNAKAPGDDRTPLWWAAWEGHHLVVKRLLQDATWRATAARRQCSRSMH